MDIMDLASKGIVAITKKYGKKVGKQKTAPKLEKADPVIIKGEKFNVGFAREEIMPDLTKGKTYWIAGHGSGHKMEDVKTPVYASAVWIDCGSGEGIVWIGADIVGFTGHEVRLVRGMLSDFAKETGCKCINISCTHSHSGIDTVGYWGKPNLVSIPSDGKDPEYMDMLMNTMVKVCKQAYANKKPGKMYSGIKEVDDSQSGRRLPKHPFHKITRLRFAPDDGSNETWILNFPAHPNSLGGSNRSLSGEYPYYLREAVKAECGADVLYGVGSIGAVDMVEYEGEEGFALIKDQGELLAKAAVSIGTDDTELTPEIKFIQQPFYYPNDNYVLTLLAMRGTFNADIYPNDISDIGLALISELTYLEIGEKKIVLVPGEMFQQTVYGGYESAENSATGEGPEINPTPLGEIAGDPDLLIFGVTNDFTGYVVAPNDFVLHKTQPYLNKAYDRLDHDHYHETNSLGVKSQSIIAETFKDMVARLDG